MALGKEGTVKVSIIVTAYLPKSKPYLDLCMQSIANLSVPKDQLEVLVVAPESYAPQYEGVRTISPPEREYHMPRGLNFGISKSRGEFVFVLNDDVILTRDCLQPLVNAMASPEIGLIMPIGNDQQGRYWLPLRRMGPYTIDQLENPEWLMNAGSPYFQGLVFFDTLCIYAFLMRRKTFEENGLFDEKLISGDDIDYCMRLRQRGYLNAIALDSLVWHAGGVSANETFTPEKRALGQKIFNEKWG
jgi:GT2 family glycosyltransferase